MDAQEACRRCRLFQTWPNLGPKAVPEVPRPRWIATAVVNAVLLALLASVKSLSMIEANFDVSRVFL